MDIPEQLPPQEQPQEEREPGFYIVIPAPVMFDERLSDGAKLLYGLIASLATHKGYCWASNAYLGKMLGKDARSIQRFIKNLSDCKHISIKIKDIYKRKIYLVNDKNDVEGDTDVIGVGQNCHGGVRQKLHDTIDITTRDDISSAPEVCNTKPSVPNKKSDLDVNLNEKLLDKTARFWGDRKHGIILDRQTHHFLGLRQRDAKIWAEAYPAVNLEVEALQAAEWCCNNGGRGKKSNYRKFLTTWYKRTQDKGLRNER